MKTVVFRTLLAALPIVEVREGSAAAAGTGLLSMLGPNSAEAAASDPNGLGAVAAYG